MLHIGVAGGMFALAATRLDPPNLEVRRSVTFVNFPAHSLSVPIDEAPKPEPMLLPTESEMTPAVLETPLEPLAPVPATPKPPLPALPQPKPVPAARPAVNLGAFASTAAAARNPDRPREIRSAGFDAEAGVSPAITTRTAAVGAFDVDMQKSDMRPGTDARAVLSTDFDRQATSAPSHTTGRIVTNAGFGAASDPTRLAPARAISHAGFGLAANRTSQPPRTEAVRTAGFDARLAQPAATVVAKSVRAMSPVEVFFKPTPAYTDEAREKKIEGEVVLEVEFTASSQVRVVRVVRGLGHGLDEMAIRAAEQIRFTPAVTDGRPIDSRANVNIVFRLT